MLLKEQLEKQLKSLVSTKDAQDILSKATEENEDYTIRFKITNESQDRDGETIVSKGIDWTHFDKNPVFLIDHKYTVGSIAGKVIDREIKGTETYLTVSLAKGTSAGELVKTLHEQGMIKGVSIGFMPLERDANDRSIITKSEALEASAVAIGSNREALMDEKTIKACKELGMIKDEGEDISKAFTTETVTPEQLRAGDVIAYRYVKRYTIDDVEEVRPYPDVKKLPRMGMLIQILNNGEEVLKWGEEAVIATKKDPILTIQGHVSSEDGPKSITMNIEMGKHSNYFIERIVPNKEVEKSLEDIKKESSEDEIDIKQVFNIIKEVKDEISSMKKIEPISDDKEKEKAREEAREKARKSGQEFQKHLSVLLNVEK